MRTTTPKHFLSTIGLICCLTWGIADSDSKAQNVSAPAMERYVPTQEQLRGNPQVGRVGQRMGNVYKSQLVPHWFGNNTRFWYRNELRGGNREFIVVDAERARREPAFDHRRLAASLSQAVGAEHRADHLPFDSIEFLDEEKSLRFKVGDNWWKCDLANYSCTKTASPANTPQRDRSAQPQTGQGRGQFGTPQRTTRSPDGKWTASIKEGNVVIRAIDDDKDIPLSQDGKSGLEYGNLQWSPDSKTLVAFRIEPGDNKEVHLIESSPKAAGRAVHSSRPYPLPGDKFTAYELSLFDIAERKQIKPAVDRVDFGRPRLRWKQDGSKFTYEKVDRGHQRFRVIEVDAKTGDSQNIIDEKTETFLWTAHAENVGMSTVNWLAKTDEIIYASERDGWRHLYLVDSTNGDVKQQITRGNFVVRGIDRIDEDNRQIWFRASGKNADQDPYFIHFYRINFDGTGLVALTAGNGSHTVQFSPDRRFVIDTYSRVDAPPMHELRRVSDGSLVYELERADISELTDRGFETPEVFTAKGRDGKTDIWGIITRPAKFDPTKKYPVIESIYAGPHGSFTPKTFSPFRRFAALNDLGFIVVQMDGMGTANRSKAFHDVCWQNIKDAGFPDRILWHQAVAKKYAYYDTTRVGIYGTSAGGQNSTGALLFHPDFYKAAVSACGCHDNRMDKASWNEQWMGYPVGPQYAASSNIDNAHRLRGKLLLIVGEMDTNVPPESTFRLADALIKAGKDFDLLVVPGMGHSNGGTYGTRRLHDFFVRHLHGVEPPDRNQVATAQEKPAQATPAQPNTNATQPAERKESVAADNKPNITMPDLRELQRQSRSEFRSIVEWFNADRTALQRFYHVVGSPTRHQRLSLFYYEWREALRRFDAASLSEQGKKDYTQLRETVDRALTDLEIQQKQRAEIAAWFPFAATIIDLEESRQQMQKVDAAATARRLTELKKQVDDLRHTVENSLKSESTTPIEKFVSKNQALRTAEMTTSLQGALKRWFDFHNSYDPLFTWWLADPYPKADEALRTYATFLREQVAPQLPEEVKPEINSKDLPDVVSRRMPHARELPDLQKMMAGSRSGMTPVIERYQTDRGQLFRSSSRPGRGSSGTPSPERIAQSKEFHTQWTAALEQLDFDALDQAGKIDYLLLKNHITRELRRLELPPVARSENSTAVPSDGSGIVGRPIGRDALLIELAGEMIPYTPEELMIIAEREYAWCEAEMLRASRDMGFGEDWRAAVEKVKTMHVEPGKQPQLIRDLAQEALDYVTKHNLVTVPPLAAETWRMEMMSPQRQLVNPFFTGGEVISVSFPTNSMPHEAKLQSMRGNNIPFSRATVHHELIPGHHLQGFMTARYRTDRNMFTTSFWGEGWALYWEMVLYAKGFPQTPEDRVGFLFWRMHRCARIVFSLGFHLGQMSPQECVDYLVRKVGHERDNAAAEVRRSVGTGYGPLYQAAYMLGGLQFRALREELVDTGKLTDRAFHDAILKSGRIPVTMVRASLTNQPITRDGVPEWKFYGPLQ